MCMLNDDGLEHHYMNLLSRKRESWVCANKRDTSLLNRGDIVTECERKKNRMWGIKENERKYLATKHVAKVSRYSI